MTSPTSAAETGFVEIALRHFRDTVASNKVKTARNWGEGDE